ncbi:ribonuclease III [Candidatus Symbiothrix dinenymphae]|nr:ribonuclease III [Candidatus Symbiothrix dinenymphae]
MKTFWKHIRLFFHPKKEFYFALYQILGFFPSDISLYEEALRHKSFFNVRKRNRALHDNERLEFLGDSILDSIVADILFRKFPNKKEGFLTTTRSKIVKRETLDRIGNELGLGNLLFKTSQTPSNNSHIYGNTLEAFIGAVYLDCGYRKARRFIEEKILNRHINIEAEIKKEVNFKSKLLEWSQRRHVTLSYDVETSWLKSEHHFLFNSIVRLNGVEAGRGTGYSKKGSHQEAAQVALKKVHKNKAFVATVVAARGAESGQP